jgi:phage shock protein C
MPNHQIGEATMMHKELYRDPVNGKLTGVCAGLANYFGIEVWLIRILVISAALLGGSFLVILAYIAMSLMVEKQPDNFVEQMKHQQEHQLKSKPWKQGQTAKELLVTVSQDLNSMENNVRQMEAYVTSETFRVNREFRNL